MQNMDALFLFLTGMTGALAPFSYLVKSPNFGLLIYLGITARICNEHSTNLGRFRNEKNIKIFHQTIKVKSDDYSIKNPSTSSLKSLWYFRWRLCFPSGQRSTLKRHGSQSARKPLERDSSLCLALIKTYQLSHKIAKRYCHY